jgi:PhzF family phenazine biosynthesis protein
MKLSIYHVDAFAEKVFTGNPAAVIPLEKWIDPALMQAIAAENNLPETAFIVKDEEYYGIRWFTPEFEIDLCGHATLAAAYVIKNFLEPHIKQVHFTTQKVGPLQTFIEDNLYTLDFPARMPQSCTPPPQLLQSLGITNAVEILRSRDYFVVLPNEEAVRNVEPDYTLMKEIETIGVIITAKGHDWDVVSRCFYPGAGIPEDPVTGSAHCNIIPYWSEKLNKKELVCRQISPRGGTVISKLKEDRVLMSGTCHLYMTGEISLS